jgi:opacity protein-like surface antigen
MVALNSFAVAGGDFVEVVEPVLVVPAEVDNSSFYVGVGLIYNRVYATDSGWFDSAPDTQDETGGFTGLVGYNFNEYIAVEGRISQSFFEENYADVFTYSLFVKPQYPVTEDFSIYGLLGFGGVMVDGAEGNHPGAANPGDTILDDTGFQWGIGASYAFTEAWSVFVDYTSLIKDGDIDSKLYDYDTTTYKELSVDAVTAGVTYTF